MNELEKLAINRHMTILREGERWHLLCVISGDVLYDNLSTKQLSDILLKDDKTKQVISR